MKDIMRVFLGRLGGLCILYGLSVLYAWWFIR